MGEILISFTAFSLTLVSAIILTHFCIKAALKLDFLDYPRGRKNHVSPTPLLGGVAIYLALFSGIYCPVVISTIWPDILMDKFSFSSQIITGAIKKLPLLNVIFFTGLGLLIIGLIDDKKGMNPYLKLFFQILAGSIMYFFGIKITLFVKNEIFSYIATTFWFVLLINSFNLLDNMDGLSAGIAMVITILMFFISHFFNNFLMSFFCAAIAGALLGFLVFNFYKLLGIADSAFRPESLSKPSCHDYANAHYYTCKILFLLLNNN